MKKTKVNDLVCMIEDYDYQTDIRKEYYDSGVVLIKNSEPVSIEKILFIGEMFGRVHSDKTKETYISDYNKDFGTEHSMDQFHVDSGHCIHRISNAVDEQGRPLGALGSQKIFWHADYSHMEGEFHGTVLYNHQNGHLAKTAYCNMVSAYGELSEEEKEYLGDAIGLHRLKTTDYNSSENNIDLSAKEEKDIFRGRVNQEPQRRPIVSQHPINKKKALYLSPATYLGSNKEIDISRVTEKSLSRHNIYIHNWEPYDLVVHDNLISMHMRTAVKPGIRVMYRMGFDYSKGL